MSNAVTEANGYETVVLNPQQAAVVADEVRFLLGHDVDVAAGALDRANEAVTPEALDSLEALISKYRRALDQLAWGAPSADVELTAESVDLNRIVRDLESSGTERIANPEAYVGMAEGYTEREPVRDRGYEEVLAARAIASQVETKR